MTETKYIPHAPSPRQTQFLKFGCLEALYGGQAGCAKSDSLLMSAAQGVTIPEYSGILFRRTYRDLALSGALMDRARSWWQRLPGVKWNGDDKRIEFTEFGSSISFGYLDAKGDETRYQSAEFQFIGFDELTQFEEFPYLYLFSRLRRTKSFPQRFPLRMRGATNPGGIGHGWVLKRFRIPEGKEFPVGCDPIVTVDDDGSVARVFLPAHPKDNPGLDWASYHKSLAQLPEVQRMQLERGIWIQDTCGKVFSSFDKLSRIDRLPDGHKWSNGVVVDIGASNNVAIALMATAADLPQTFVRRVYEPENMNTPRELAEELRRLDTQYHFDWMACDQGGLGKAYVNEFRKWYQLPVQYVDKSDKAGHLRLLDGAIADAMLIVVGGQCDTFEQQASALLWKDERQLEEMPSMRNHSVDAVLYGWRKAAHYSHVPKDTRGEQFDELEISEMTYAQTRYAREQETGMIGLPDLFG